MKKNFMKKFGFSLTVATLLVGTVTVFGQTTTQKTDAKTSTSQQPKKTEKSKSSQQNKGVQQSNQSQEPKDQATKYSTAQAMSDKAQLSTIAFSGLAFITGDDGSDSFFPPGKVADFFGFQYMRDVDVAGYGHNTQFLTRVANNVLKVLNEEQKAKIVALSKEQAPIYTMYAYNRFPLMKAFRENLNGKTGLSEEIVGDYSAKMYKLDADLSYNRAVVLGEIINSLTQEQKDYLAKMDFNNFNTWPDVPEDEALKKSLTNTEYTAVMTYASELFSWYKGDVESDTYFCPERHGTYFGGFYMKDYPAMNNPDYFISTAVTGDKGQEFLNILNDDQRKIIESIIPEQKLRLEEIAKIRAEVSTELRKAQTGGTIDKTKVYALIERYGELDGELSALYSKRFAEVNKTLTPTQKASLVKLRDLDVTPKGAYMFSTEIAKPVIPNTNYFFGSETMPKDAGNYQVPASFVPLKK